MYYSVGPQHHQAPPCETCAQGHSTAFNLPTSEGGKICLVCFSNLISNPKSPTIHVSYAISQLSQALGQPQFLHTFVTFHSHFLISPLVHALSAFNDFALAGQIVELCLQICEAARDSDVFGDFIAKLADHLSSYSLAWSRQQVYILHCLGVLLDHQKNDPLVQVKDKHALVSNLITGLQVPSEDIQGESLFVLYKLSLIQAVDDRNNFVEVLEANCAKLFHLSLEALMKTQDDDIRMNCVALLTVFAHRGWFQTFCMSEVMDYCESENFMQTVDQAYDQFPLITLFAEAIKGPLLSSDSQVQVATLDLIFMGLSSRANSAEEIQVLVEENITDYVFEILRLSGCKDPVASSCIRVLDLLSTAVQAFRQRLAIGFPTLIPALQYVAEVPFHPAQTQSLKLVSYCVSNCPGVVSTSHVEEIGLILTGLLKKHIDGESGIASETFNLACSLLVSLMTTFSASALNLNSLQDASEGAVLTCLRSYDKHPDQFLYALYLFKEAFCFSFKGNQNKPINMDLISRNFYLCKTQLLPWFMRTINSIDEEDIILGVVETFNAILMLDSNAETRIFADTLVSSSWFSVLLGCLGSFPTEKMKLNVYGIFSSIVDVLSGNNGGQSLRVAASLLPSDPMDLLFLLGQKGSHDVELLSCQSAVLQILYISSLYDDRLADDKLVLSSLEQYILLNGSDFLYGASTSVAFDLLVNVYGLYRGLAKTGYQVPYSNEAEKLLFELLNQKEWDLLSLNIHFMSLKWLFQQEKICGPLTEQMLRLCRCSNCGGHSVIVYGKDSQNLDVTLIADLIVGGDNFGAVILVFLLGDLIEKEGPEDDMISVVNTILEIIQLQPAASDQLCMHGLARPVCNIYTHSRYSSVPDLNVATSKLILTILCSVKSESLDEHDAWVDIVAKLIDYLINTIRSECWMEETPLVIGILALVLHHSTDQALVEASKIVLLSTPLNAVINTTILEACSKGHALIDHDEGTQTGEALMFLLLLIFFSLKSFQAVLPGMIEWYTFIDEVSQKQSASCTSLRCHDFCKLLHFGSPPVKLISSYCLLEILNRISTMESTKQTKPHIRRGYLSSIKAILEGLIFSSDVTVSVNCSLCLSLLIEWKDENFEKSAVGTNTWFRMIVEELVMSLTVPHLASKSLPNYHKPAINVTIALLKLKEIPEWMTIVFDEPRITGIIKNISTSNLTTHLVLLFRELLQSGYLTAEHITSLNRVFQACRQHLYVDEMKNDSNYEKKTKANEVPNGVGNIFELLINLMSSHRSTDTSLRVENTNKDLLAEIESFLKCLMEEEKI
ncbi:OLC1v1018922C1 [Oldenlandia corymbosa var. corymbosa]|uniref:OLC1v1018922C1 n=1 Tax=Oldenlandia corymbosa var. corymbosa TaxID=529605 RepID=A0AAV1ECR5_OLDCO|nr:OLC1v1018922C1 [Oldenlandia corymbosa var. corymbosa]